MKNHFRILLLFVSLLFIISCDDQCESIECLNNGICNEGVCECPDGYEGTNCEIELSAVKRFLKRENKESYYTDYEYTNEGLLKKKSVFRNTGILWYESNYDFDNDTLYVTRITYNQDTDTSILKFYNLDVNVIEKKSSNYLKQFTFSSDCSISRLDYGDGDYQIHEYIDSNCSYLATGFNNNEVIVKAIYILDNGKTPVPSLFEYFMPSNNLGNIVSIDVFDLDIDNSGNTSYNHSTSVFIIDKYGYPIKEESTSLSGEVSITTYEYFE